MVNFVSRTDSENIKIMLDAPLIILYDVELGAVGVRLFQPDNETWDQYDQIRTNVTQFFSSSSNYGNGRIR